jgi:hypothetical protein
MSAATVKGGFWTTNVGFEPKAQYRFKVRLNGFTWEDRDDSGPYEDIGTDTDVVWYAKSITKPTMKLTAQNVGEFSINRQFDDAKILTFPTFEPVTMKLIDPSYPNATRKILRWVRRAGFLDDEAQGTNGVSYFDYDALHKAIGDLIIEQLDHTGGVMETWKLLNAYPTTIDYGSLSYASSAPVEISITWGYSVFQAVMHGQPGLEGGVYSQWPIDERSLTMLERGFEYYRDADEVLATSLPDDLAEII